MKSLNNKHVPRVFVLYVLIALLLAGGLTAADRHLIAGEFSSRLDALTREDIFRQYLNDNRKDFPRHDPGHPIHVRVRKEKIRTAGKSFSAGISHSQIYIECSLKKLADILRNPEYFRDFYNLDGSAEVDGPSGVKRARIYKKIPLLPNQEFLLEFSEKNSQSFWFQRARLIRDYHNFALRDNLKILEPVPGGVIYREISYVYPLKWWARTFAPTVRRVMGRELRKMAVIMKCILEKPGEYSNEVARQCWIKTGK